MALPNFTNDRDVTFAAAHARIGSFDIPRYSTAGQTAAVELRRRMDDASLSDFARFRASLAYNAVNEPSLGVQGFISDDPRNLDGSPARPADVQRAQMGLLLDVMLLGYGRGLNAARSGSYSATVYRVQGGIGDAASRSRIAIGESGDVSIEGVDKLYVTFDDVGRARAFLHENRPGGSILAFDVEASFVREVRRKAVPQAQARMFPEMPEIADPTKTSSSFGLPAPWIRRLQEAIKPGTGRILE